MKKTTDSMIKTNKEYVKLRSGQDSTPREQPSRQMPGTKGHDRPEYSRWTDQELRETAQTLNIEGHDTLDREQLIEAIVARQQR